MSAAIKKQSSLDRPSLLNDTLSPAIASSILEESTEQDPGSGHQPARKQPLLSRVTKDRISIPISEELQNFDSAKELVNNCDSLNVPMTSTAMQIILGRNIS